MTPSDFVEYAVHRYHKWADNMYTKQSSDLAFYQNAFPMSPITDVVDDYAEQLTPMPVERGGASDNCNNPFAQADRLIELHMKKRFVLWLFLKKNLCRTKTFSLCCRHTEALLNWGIHYPGKIKLHWVFVALPVVIYWRKGLVNPSCGLNARLKFLMKELTRSTSFLYSWYICLDLPN